MKQWQEFFDDKKYTRFFLLLSLLFIAGGIFLMHTEKTKEQEIQLISQNNETVLLFQKKEKKESPLPFLENLMQEEGLSITKDMEEKGISVLKSEENDGENDKFGKFHEIRLKGRGNFSQILETFDIIGYKERWSAVELKEIKRAGQELDFELSIRTFQSRGRNEKKEYRTDWPHGNREKQSGENII